MSNSPTNANAAPLQPTGYGWLYCPLLTIGL